MTTKQRGPRPQAKTLVRIDPNNAYARLGLSPRATIKEIQSELNQRRSMLMNASRGRADQRFGDEEAQIIELQRIEKEIGSARARARHDETNPQNELLVVQTSPRDRGLMPDYRDAVISAWLVEELGRMGWLPTAESARLWAPRGLPEELVQFLRPFVRAGESPSPSSRAHQDEREPLPDGVRAPAVDDLDRIDEQRQPISAIAPMIQGKSTKHG